MKKTLLVLLAVLCMLPVALMGQCGTSKLTATDADGNNYQSLKLGPHCWLLTNLKANVPGSMIYYSDLYSDKATNLDTYGRLYTWAAAVGDPMVAGEHDFVQGICPEGWHIPNEAEVLELTSYIAPDVHATTHWLIPGTNLTNYTQMPGGFYNAAQNRCENLLGEAYFWSIGSAPGFEPVEVWSDCNCEMVMLNPGKVQNGLSVRCVYGVYRANVTTVDASNVTETYACLNGNVVFAGYDENYERGFQWGSDRNNLTNLLQENTSANTEGLYNKMLTGLTANTTYYYRAYVVNEFDTTFGVVRSFTTLGEQPPVEPMVVTSAAADNITKEAATLHGTVTSLGENMSVTAGFKYGTSEDALTDEAGTTNLAAAGSFNGSLTSLSDNTTYYYCAFATAGGETVYGDTLSFTTLEEPIPGEPMAVTTDSATTITKASATLHGTVTSLDENESVTAGFLYGTSEDALTDEAGPTTLTEAGSFSGSLTSLSDNTTYYYCAFATAGGETVYGDTLSFTTLEEPIPGEPMAVTTDSATTITKASATLHGTVTSLGDNTSVTAGFKYGTSEDALTDEAGTTTLTEAGSYSGSLSGLSDNTTYYYCAFATAGGETVYGDTLSFTTFAKKVMTVTTDNAGGITKEAATLHGAVTSLGENESVTAGFLYGTSANALTGEAVTTNLTAAGSYSGSLTSLSDSTKYYYCAFATAGGETVYGDTLSFTTLKKKVMTVTTAAAGNITKEAATLHGAVTSLGENESVTAGFLYGTSANALTGEAVTTNLTAAGSYSGSLTSLDDNTTYYYCAFASADGETVYGDTLSFTTLENTGFTCGIDSVADLDGNRYATIKIGTQCWMAENLRTTTSPSGKMMDGNSDTTGIENRYYFKAQSSDQSITELGLLYSYSAAVDANVTATKFPVEGTFCQGICPEGWHIPTTADFTVLQNYDGGIDMFKTPYAGYYAYGELNNSGAYAYFWSANPSSDINLAKALSRYNKLSTASIRSHSRTYGFSVRCLFDGTKAPSSAVITLSADNVTTESAQLHGIVTSLDENENVTAGFKYGTSKNALTSEVGTTTLTEAGRYAHNLTGLSDSTTYYYCAFATAGDTTVYGDTLSFITMEDAGFTCGIDSVADLDGNRYATIKIGTQCWMAENLRTITSPSGKMMDGNSDTTGIENRYYFKAQLSDQSITELGLLYSYSAAIDSNVTTTKFPEEGTFCQGICPEGWHIPTTADFTVLQNYNGGIDTFKTPYAGYYANGKLNNFGTYAYFWSANPSSDINYAKALSRYNRLSTVSIRSHSRTYGFSVRCLFDGTKKKIPAVITASTTAITTKSATLHGTVVSLGENASVTAGFKYGTSKNVLISEAGTMTQSAAGKFDYTLTDLTAAMKYYYRAFVTNGIDTVWGEVKDFTTYASMSVTTDNADNVLVTTATLHGTVNELSYSSSVNVGFKYGTSADALTTKVDGSTMMMPGAYSIDLIDLTAATTYYYKAFETNGTDTAWGEVKDFTTYAPMSVTTDRASHVQMTIATLHGTVNELSASASVIVGFKYGTSEDALTGKVDGNAMMMPGAYSIDLIGLTVSTTYYYKAFETNGIDTVWGEVRNFITNSPIICGQDSLKDIEGNQYATVKLGSQCWMAENLRTVDSLTYDVDYHYPNDNADRVNTYGLLYTWKAAFKEDTADVHAPMIQGICPEGWHLPSSEEWNALAAYMKRQPDYRCDNDEDYISKSLASTSGWVENTRDCAVGNNQSLNNATGFNAFPAGACQFINYGYANTGTAIDFGKYTRFWTSTVIKDLMGIDSIDLIRLSGLDYEQTGLSWQDMPLEINVGEPTMSVDYGFSVRCVWNLLTVTTDSADNITYNSADLHGTVAVMDNNNGLSASAGFVYGTTPNALNRTQSVNINQEGTYDVSIQRLTPNTLYYYRAFVVKDNDTVWGNQTKEFSTAVFQFFKPCVSTPTVTDGMGNVYPTVQIGTQCWMAQNMRTTQSVSPEDYKFPNNDSQNVEKYGYLYSWEAATNNNTNSVNPAQGICPAGWQIPYVKDVDTLTAYLKRHSEFLCNDGSNAIAKSLASREGWTETSSPCSVGFEQQYKNNATCFNAYPDGGWNDLEEFSYFGKKSRFWLYNEENIDAKKAFSLGYNEEDVIISKLSSAYTFYFPVRCVRIERAEELPVSSANMSVITRDADAIELHSATLNGTIEATGVNVPVAAGFRYGVSEDAMDSIVTMDNFMNPQDFSFNITNLDHSVTCYYQAFVTDGADTVWGEVMNFTTLILCGIDSVADIDGNSYSTVKIGTQCWMQSNLRTKRYANGGAIGGNAKFYHVKNDESNDATYGLLYNWAAVMGTEASSNANPSGVQGICPDGWHVPSDAEWTQLTNYVSSKDIYLCSSENTNYFAPALASNKNGDWAYSVRECAVGNHPSNATGFSALPAGTYSSGEGYAGFGNNADFWSATQSSATNAHRRDLNYTWQSVFDYTADKALGYSVRCLSDLAFPITMHVSTGDPDNIMNSSATLHGILYEMGQGHTSVKVGFKYGISEDALDREVLSGAIMSTPGAYSCKLTGLAEGTEYYYRAFATAGNDTVWGSIQTVHGFICGVEKLVDIDNNKYATVKIGTQCWMAENLRTMADLSYLAPNGDYNNVGTYGLLYTWNTATKRQASDETHPMVQGICPKGWHIPSKDEWETMTKYVFDQPYYRCGSCSTWEENTGCIAKALASTTGWRTSADNPCLPGSDASTNNKTGFNAVPAGSFFYNIVFSDAIYYGFDSIARFHSSTIVQAEPLDYSWSASVNGDSLNFQYGKNAFLDYSYLSVRCVSDIIYPLVMTVATDSSNKVSSSAVLLHGMAKSLGDNDEVTVGFKYGENESNLNQIVTKTVIGVSPYACFIDVEDEDSIYYYKAFMTNGTDTVWGETKSFANLKFTCGTDKIYDVEGNRYATVRIGHQCWMAENLRTTEGLTCGENAGGSNPYYYYPNNNSSYVNTYGLLYNWKAITGHGISDNITEPVQGVCPRGWHVPGSSEWDRLTYYIGLQPDYVCPGCNTESGPCIAKSMAATSGWTESTFSCNIGNQQDFNNKTGFNARPAGSLKYTTSSPTGDFGNDASFWSTAVSGQNATCYKLSYFAPVMQKVSANAASGLSVRCLCDDPYFTIRTVSATSTYSAATLQGELLIGVEDASFVTVGFKYGATEGVVNKIETQVNASGSYNLKIQGLDTSKTYFYKAFVIDGMDTIWGELKDFTTPSKTSITTGDAGDVTYHSATLNATIDKMGGYTYVWTGFKYGTEPSNLSQKIRNYVSSHEIGTFNCTPTDLISETTYYYQAFVVNETDTIYGGVESLTTKKISEVATDSTFQITNNSTTLYGTLKGLESCSSVAVGFKYGTNADALYNVVTCDEVLTNIGTFSYKIGGLNDSTNYYYQAFEAHLSDTVYGQVKNFTTKFISVTTESANQVTNSSASLCGSTELGGNTLVIAGFRYGTDPSSLSGMVSKRVTKEGYYNCDINGLIQNTTYYYQAFLTDGTDTVWDDNVNNFTTLGPVVVNTDSVTDITNCSAKMYGTIEEMSGHSSLTAGFIFGTSQNTLTETVETIADGVFSCKISAPIILNANTTYYYKAFAATDNETFYGEIKTFKTSSSIVTTNNAKSIKNTEATLQAHIDNPGGMVTVGFKYGPKFLNMNTVALVAQTQVAQDFSCIVEYLTPRETYYYKAFAASGKDTVWGDVMTFTTTDDCNDGLGYGSQCWAKSNVGGSSLYTWQEATGGINSNEVPSGVQGICPTGWHLPSRAEWEIFMNYMYIECRDTFSATVHTWGKDYTDFCPAKAMASKNWPCKYTYAEQITVRHPFAFAPAFEPSTTNNRSGFSAEPYGIRNAGEAFVSENGDKAYFWSSTNDNSLFFNLFGTDATSFIIIGFRSEPVLGGTNKNSAISVRCLRDYGTPTPARSVTTNAASKIMNRSATLNGRVNALGDLTNYVVAGFKYGTDQDQLNSIVKNQEPVTRPGDFSCKINNLSSPKYYYKAFAAVGTDTTWGETKYFDNIVNVTTDSVRNIKHYSVEMFCTAKNVQPDENIIMCVAYGTSEGAMTMQVVNSDKNDYVYSRDFPYSYKLTNLTPSTQYYYQAYVIRDGDTVFATDVKTFKTHSAVALAVSTDSCSNITRGSGILNGTLNRFDGSDSVKIGFKYCEVVFNNMEEYNNMNRLSLKADQVTRAEDPSHFSAPLASLKPNTYYYYVAYAVYQEDTVYGKIEKFKTATVPCSGQLRPNEGGTNGAITSVTDVDNNVYGVVQIGPQCWMNENLKTTKYIDGTEISQNSDDNNNPKFAGFGLFYDWDVVAKGRQTAESISYGLCPQGWKIPTMEDWTALMDYSGVVCMDISSFSYCVMDSFVDNTSGFSFYNTGYYGTDSVYTYDEYYYNYGCAFRLATDYSNPNVASIVMRRNQGSSLCSYVGVKDISNVRCVRSNAYEDLNVVTNRATNNNTETSATCNYTISQNIGINVAERGICWNTSGNPSLANSHTSEGTGTGTFTSSISGLNPGTTYRVRAYATDGDTVIYGNVVSFTTLKCGNGKIKDVDGNEYETVKIGSQCWMKSNLRVTHFANGDAISGGLNQSSTNAYCYFDKNDNIDITLYGRLYNWAAAMDNSASSTANPSGIQGVCPTGWHLPSKSEWDQLTNYISENMLCLCENPIFVLSSVAKSMAYNSMWAQTSTSQNRYPSCNPGGNQSSNNGSGFSAIPAGYYYNGFNGKSQYAEFWSSTQENTSNAWCLEIGYDSAAPNIQSRDKSSGCSIRCVLD